MKLTKQRLMEMAGIAERDIKMSVKPLPLQSSTLAKNAANTQATKIAPVDLFKKQQYSEGEVKYALGVDDNYEGWAELADQKGFEYDEAKDVWYYKD